MRQSLNKMRCAVSEGKILNEMLCTASEAVASNKKRSRTSKISAFNIHIMLTIYAFLLSLAVFMLSTEPLSTSLICISHNPIIVLWNFIPVLLLSFALYYLLGNFTISAWFSTLIFFIAALINHFKIIFRNDPFIPSDVVLLPELWGFLGIFGSTISARVLILSIVFFTLLILSLFIKTEKLSFESRSIAFLGVVALALTLNMFVYADKDLYKSYYNHGQIYKQADIYNSKGFVYSFWHNLNQLSIQKPEGYSKKKALEILPRSGDKDSHTSKITSDGNDNNTNGNITNEGNSSYKNGGALDGKNKFNVIFIISEAFSELSEHEFFNKEQYDDPLKNYKALKKDALHGKLTVPNFGGGTANTEFDVLTGLYTMYIKDSPSSFWHVRKPLESVVSVFKSNGYKTFAIHPGHAWFYNRQNVYRYFGFDTFISLEDFLRGKVTQKGKFVSDKTAYEKLMDVITTHRGEPLFAYLMTIQNHTPYPGKYKKEAIAFEPGYPIEQALTADETDIISNYFIGVRDGDIELKNLTDFLVDYDEPYILVFCGDHLPSLGEAMRIYDTLGYTELQKYQTGYLIWQNNMAKQYIDINNSPVSQYDVISANYLGASVLELLGLKSPFFDYLNDLRKDAPVISKYSDMSEADELIKDFKTIQYYKLTN